MECAHPDLARPFAPHRLKIFSFGLEFGLTR
jgi:hypothetical protein